jgi:tagatose 6-phosphate kinase
MSDSAAGQSILAAGLSPAWQQILAFDAFQIGEVNRAHETHACASGKVLNVGLALHRLGANVRTLSLIGGAAAEQIKAEFVAAGAAGRWIDAESPTRVCTTVVDLATGGVTELVENARPVTIEELEQFVAAYRAEAAKAGLVVLSGSLPRDVAASLYYDLAKSAQGRVIVDAQGPLLLESLPARPYLVKPNRQELGRTLGIALADDAELQHAMQELRVRGAEWVVVSDGKNAVWASGPDGVFRAQPPVIDRAINPIGSGDCLAAGLAWRLSLDDSVPAALPWAIAAAAENARQLLPARIDPGGVERLQGAVVVERM